MTWDYEPMNEAQLVYCFDRQNHFSHVKPRDVFTKDFIFDEHGHEVAAG